MPFAFARAYRPLISRKEEHRMKYIISIIKPGKLDEVREAL